MDPKIINIHTLMNNSVQPKAAHQQFTNILKDITKA